MNITETIRPAIRHAGHTLTGDQARAKMQEYIEAAKARAVDTLVKIQNVVPTDRLVKAPAIEFSAESGALEYFAPGLEPERLHRNALTQLAGRLDIPMAYVDHLDRAQTDQTPNWGRDFLARTLREHVTHSEDRYLIRSVDGEARAVLSDKYRRRDCRPGALMLLEAAKGAGMIVSDGSFTDTRSAMKFIKPEPIEVFPGEYMVFGFDWSNSDYGRGASDLRLFLFRLWCWNGAVGESVLRQIHIGKRLQDGVDYQQDTIEADAHASALALRDAAASATSPKKIAALIEGVKAANEQKIDPKNRVETLKKTLNKGEVEQVVQAFNSPDVENMPAGNTLWRWSNAISWVGGGLPDADRRIDFERLAGDVLKPVMPAADAPPAMVDAVLNG